MIRLRPHLNLFELSYLRHSGRCLIRTYATRKLDPENVNYPLLTRLHEEYVEYSNEPNHEPFKLKALKTATDAIKNLPYKIQSVNDVDKVKGIGPGIKRRIEEFLLSQEGQTAQNALQDPEFVQTKKELLAATDLFQTVSGIGPQRARVLAEKGFKTLQDVIDDTETFKKLPTSVQTALLFSSRIIEKIPREEIDRLSGVIQETLKKEFEVHIMGSYRRGAQSSSDIDVLLFHEDYKHVPVQNLRTLSKAARESAKDSSPLHKIAIPKLKKAKLLTEPLTSGPTRWQGLASLMNNKDMFCRVDLNLMPTDCKGAALVGFTGDAEFNKMIRARAIKRGLRLNEFGLWKRPDGWEPSEATKHEDGWEVIPTTTEESVFEQLGEVWVEPTKRNFNNLASKRKRNS